MLRPRRAIRGDLSFSRYGRGEGKQRLRWKIFFLPSFSHHYSIDTYNKAWNQLPGPTFSFRAEVSLGRFLYTNLTKQFALQGTIKLLQE